MTERGREGYWGAAGNVPFLELGMGLQVLLFLKNSFSCTLLCVLFCIYITLPLKVEVEKNRLVSSIKR